MLYADDTNLIFSSDNLSRLNILMNTELSKIYSWLAINKLTLK